MHFSLCGVQIVGRQNPARFMVHSHDNDSPEAERTLLGTKALRRVKTCRYDRTPSVSFYTKLKWLTLRVSEGQSKASE